jgi:hypothetical protein
MTRSYVNQCNVQLSMYVNTLSINSYAVLYVSNTTYTYKTFPHGRKSWRLS